MKIYNFPVKAVDEENLLDEMRKAEDNTIFILDEKVIKKHEGDNQVELTMAKVYKIKD